jgi:hypothetical protein
VLTLLLCLTALNTVAILTGAFFFVRSLIKKTHQKPTVDLADFLDDLKVHGFGVVRLDPDSLLVRSPR